MKRRQKKQEIKITPEELLSELSSILPRYHLEGWEIYLIAEHGCLIEVKEQKIESFEQEQHLGLALRVLHQGRVGFGYSTDFSSPALKQLIEEIFSRIKVLDPDPLLAFPESGEPVKNLPEIYDPSFSQRSVQEKIQQAMLLERSAYSADSRVKRVRHCQYQDNLKKVWLHNSFGLRRYGIATNFSLFTEVLAEEGTDAQISSEFDWSFQYDMLSPEKVGISAGKKACAKLGGKRIATQKVPVIFNSQVSGELMELLSYALSGENLAKNKTWLRGKEGEKIFSNAINIIDDGLCAQGPDCFPFDGEGVPSQRKLLVEKGRLRQFLFDSYYARKLKKNSTANARRERFSAPPLVGPSNFYLCPGEKSQEQLITELDNGLLIQEAMGVHTADEISGEFSLGVSGQWIHKGQLAQAISGVAIAGTLKELFYRVREVGNDLKFFQNCASPSLLVEELEISGI